MHLADVSSTAYYLQLLELFHVPRLRQSLVQGLASSAFAGTEGLGRESRAAIVSFIQCQSGRDQVNVQRLFFNVLAMQLEVTPDDERLAVPLMEFLAFLFEQDAAGAIDQDQASNHREPTAPRFMHAIQQPSSSLPRFEAMIKVYSCMITRKLSQTDALDKLSRLLLHRYPKVKHANPLPET